VIAVDTNLLVYAHRADHEWNQAAHACVNRLAAGRAAWAIPWPCVHEFIAIVTHPKVFDPPSTLKQALAQMEIWTESPSLRLIGEAPQHWSTLSKLATQAKVQGGAIHDARIAAICLENGVSELWTADRDFSRLPGLRVRNPLVER
jgi:toxin-antitoxin system PIN domain toxin